MSPLQIWFTVESTDDGSARAEFFTTEELARWHYDHPPDGWPAHYIDHLTILLGDHAWCECEQALDPVSYWLKFTEDEYDLAEEWEYRDEFLSRFFPDGLPQFEVRMPERDSREYRIFVGGELKGEWHARYDHLRDQCLPSEVGRRAAEDLLNR